MSSHRKKTGKKGWINKKNAVTFHVMPRGNTDPLKNEQGVPDNVLVPADSQTANRYDDWYDYEQHLKPIGESSHGVFIDANGKQLPAESPLVEIDPSLISQPVITEGVPSHWRDQEMFIDRDILDALNADYSNPETLGEFGGLNDAFVAEARGDYAEGMEPAAPKQVDYSRPTPETLTLHDQRLEVKMQQFDDLDEQLYDPPEVEETEDVTNAFESALDAFIEDQKKLELDTPSSENSQEEEDAADEAAKKEEEIEDDDETVSSGEEDNAEELAEKLDTIYIQHRTDTWDAQSVLSTYSNLDNHPGVLTEPGFKRITLSKKNAMPRTSSQKQRQAKPAAKKQPPTRSRNETPEEKRARKRLVKEQRKASRIRKKETKVLFKAEKKKLATAQANQYQGARYHL